MEYKSYIKPAVLLLAGLFIGLAVSKLPSSKQQTVDHVNTQGAVQTNKKAVSNNIGLSKDFDLWKLECDKDDKNCKIFQRLTFSQTMPDKSVQKVMALKLMVYLVKAEDGTQKTRIRFITPLGLDLTSGLAMRVDEGKEFKIPPQICTLEGCLSDFNLGDDVLQEMKKGNDFFVGYRFPNTKPIVLKGSLKGISAAFKKLQEQNN